VPVPPTSTALGCRNVPPARSRTRVSLIGVPLRSAYCRGPAARRGQAAAPWAGLKEKIILLGRQDGLRCAGKSPHCREFKEMNFNFAHRSSSPIWPARQFSLKPRSGVSGRIANPPALKFGRVLFFWPADSPSPRPPTPPETPPWPRRGCGPRRRSRRASKIRDNDCAAASAEAWSRQAS
jgi:hypothetical protein